MVLFLFRIHPLIGKDAQLPHVGAVRRVTDHAAAGADVDGLPLQHIGLADDRFDGFHPLRTPFCVHFAVDDKGELVAADAEGVVRVPHTAPQLL